MQIADNDQRFWIRTLNLSYKDKAIEMLTDKHINAAQKVFTQNFPLIEGFQNPLLSQKNMFVPIACNAKGIQIHHVRNNHWITSSSTAGCVEVFDSVYNNLSTDTEVQLATIYQNLAEKNVLQVKIVPCQRQTGSTDCGLFAIAWAFELANGNRPEQVTLDQEKMRAHLLNCFAKRNIVRFPQACYEERNIYIYFYGDLYGYFYGYFCCDTFVATNFLISLFLFPLCAFNYILLASQRASQGASLGKRGGGRTVEPWNRRNV